MTKNEFTMYMMNLMKLHNLTYRSFAAALEMSQTYLFDLLNGNRKPTKSVLERIINYFQMSSEEQRYLYDISAAATGKLPLDVEEYLLNNPQVLTLVIESMNASKDERKER